jgi:hypothetical protein
MIGTANRDDIDIFASDQLAVVFAALWGSSKGRPRLIADTAIHITDGNDITVQLPPLFAITLP